MLGSDTKVNSEDDVAWLDDASMKIESKLNLMSPPCDLIEEEGSLVVRQQLHNGVQPHPECERRDKL